MSLLAASSRGSLALDRSRRGLDSIDRIADYITSANFSFNKLQQLPVGLQDCGSLERLNVSHNRLKSLLADNSPVLTYLPRLRHLDVSGNPSLTGFRLLAGLTRSGGSAGALEELWCARCGIGQEPDVHRSISHLLKSLSALSVLVVADNPATSSSRAAAVDTASVILCSAPQIRKLCVSFSVPGTSIPLGSSAVADATRVGKREPAAAADGWISSGLVTVTARMLSAAKEHHARLIDSSAPDGTVRSGLKKPRSRSTVPSVSSNRAPGASAGQKQQAERQGIVSHSGPKTTHGRKREAILQLSAAAVGQSPGSGLPPAHSGGLPAAAESARVDGTEQSAGRDDAHGPAGAEMPALAIGYQSSSTVRPYPKHRYRPASTAEAVRVAAKQTLRELSADSSAPGAAPGSEMESDGRRSLGILGSVEAALAGGSSAAKQYNARRARAAAGPARARRGPKSDCLALAIAELAKLQPPPLPNASMPVSAPSKPAKLVRFDVADSEGFRVATAGEDGTIRAFVEAATGPHLAGKSTHHRSPAPASREIQCVSAEIDRQLSVAAHKSGLISDVGSQGLRQLSASVPWPGTACTPGVVMQRYLQAVGALRTSRAGIALRWTASAPGRPAIVARFSGLGRGSVDDPRSGSLLLRSDGSGQGEEFSVAGTKACRVCRWERGAKEPQACVASLPGVLSGSRRMFLLSPELVMMHDTRSSITSAFVFGWTRAPAQSSSDGAQSDDCDPVREKGHVHADIAPLVSSCVRVTSGWQGWSADQIKLSPGEASAVFVDAWVQSVARRQAAAQGARPAKLDQRRSSARSLSPISVPGKRPVNEPLQTRGEQPVRRRRAQDSGPAAAASRIRAYRKKQTSIEKPPPRKGLAFGRAAEGTQGVAPSRRPAGSGSRSGTRVAARTFGARSRQAAPHGNRAPRTSKSPGHSQAAAPVGSTSADDDMEQLARIRGAVQGLLSGLGLGHEQQANRDSETAAPISGFGSDGSASRVASKGAAGGAAAAALAKAKALLARDS